MMKKTWRNAFLFWGTLSIVAAMSPNVFAAAASQCSGNGVANGAALEHKVQNGVCDQAPEGSPVPEPSGLAMLAGGLVAIFARQMRKSKKMQ